GVGLRTGRGAPRNLTGTSRGTSACASAGTRSSAGTPIRAEPASRRRMVFLYQVRDRSATVARPGWAPRTLTERTRRMPAWRSVVGRPSPTLTRLPEADLRFAGRGRRGTRPSTLRTPRARRVDHAVARRRRTHRRVCTWPPTAARRGPETGSTQTAHRRPRR